MGVVLADEREALVCTPSPRGVPASDRAHRGVDALPMARKAIEAVAVAGRLEWRARVELAEPGPRAVYLAFALGVVTVFASLLLFGCMGPAERSGTTRQHSPAASALPPPEVPRIARDLPSDDPVVELEAFDRLLCARTRSGVVRCAVFAQGNRVSVRGPMHPGPLPPSPVVALDGRCMVLRSGERWCTQRGLGSLEWLGDDGTHAALQLTREEPEVERCQLDAGRVRCLDATGTQWSEVPLPGVAVQLASSGTTHCSLVGDEHALWCWRSEGRWDLPGGDILFPGSAPSRITTPVPLARLLTPPRMLFGLDRQNRVFTIHTEQDSWILGAETQLPAGELLEITLVMRNQGRIGCAVREERVVCWSDQRVTPTANDGYEAASAQSLERILSDPREPRWWRSPDPVALARRPAVRIAVHDSNGCAIVDTGHVLCWPIASAEPHAAQVVGVGGAREIALADGYGCIIDASSDVWCWGHYPGREPSTDPPTASRLPEVGGTVEEIALDHSALLVRLSDGTVRLWSESAPAWRSVDLPRAREIAFRFGRVCVRPVGRTEVQCGEIDEPSGWRSLFPAGSRPGANHGISTHTLCTCASGQLYCALPSLASLSAGPITGCSAQDRMFAGGFVVAGQVLRRAAVQWPGDAWRVIERPIPRTRVVATHRGTVCWAVDGAVECVVDFGDEVVHELRRDDWARVEGLVGIVALAVGGTHACALDEAGRVLCWGANEEGQCGPGPGTVGAVREPVLDDATAVSVFRDLSCALTRAGAVRCWGALVPPCASTAAHCPFPRVGPTPRLVEGLPQPVDELRGTCARRGRRWWCWGADLAAHAARGPATVPGAEHRCELRDGQVLCRGEGERGQLGNAHRNGRSFRVIGVGTGTGARE